MAKVKVVIPDERYIPTLGKGPFRKPIAISEETFRMLSRMNYVLRVVEGDENETTMEEVSIERQVVGKDDVTILETPLEEDEEETDVVDQINISPESVIINADNIILDQEETEEDIDEDEEEEEPEELEPKDHFTEEELDFLKNDALKKEITDKFDEKGIKYNSTATIKELLDIVNLER